MYWAEFTINREHELLLRHKPMYRREQLDKLELSMLQAEPVPGLLDVEWVEMDEEITFRYRLTGRRMVAPLIRLHRFTMQDYYLLLLTLVETLERCRAYLLRPEGVLLHEDYMFAGERWDSLNLVYVPIVAAASKETSTSPPLKERLLVLAVRWMAHIDQVDGNGLQQVLHMLEQEETTLADLQRLLLALLSESCGFKDEVPVLTQGVLEAPNVPKELKLSQGSRLPDPSYQPSHNPAPLPAQDAVYAPAPALDPAPARKEVTEAASSRMKWLTVLVATVLVALCWRYYYMPAPGSSALITALGATCVLLATAGYVVWRISVRSQADGIFPEMEADEENASDYNPDGRWPAITTSPPEQSPAVMMEQSAMASSERWIAAAQTDGATVLLSNENADRHSADAANVNVNDKRGVLRLKRLDSVTGIETEIIVASGAMIIGRTEGSADIVDKGEGVSRAHVELVIGNTQWTVKDVGSRNGTWLNGQLMVPYRSYTLQPEDHLQLAGTQGPVYQRK